MDMCSVSVHSENSWIICNFDLSFSLFGLRFKIILFNNFTGFTGFYWILLVFTGFYWFLLDFNGFTGFYWVPLTHLYVGILPAWGLEIEPSPTLLGLKLVHSAEDMAEGAPRSKIVEQEHLEIYLVIN